MSWLEKLSQTYDNCTDSIGLRSDRTPLIPVCHITQYTQIEISIDGRGNFRTARIVPRDECNTIIPCTEKSAGRTSGIESHPLCDRLKYLADDFYKFTGEKPPTAKKGKKPKFPHQEYLNVLTAWCNSHHRHPKAEAILAYVKKGTVMADLCSLGIFSTDQSCGRVIAERKNTKSTALGIWDVMKGSGQPWDAFVRWVVAIPGDPSTQTFWDESLWRSWRDYDLSGPSTKGICQVGGDIVRLSTQHPKKIRNPADGAKLISANDEDGYTYRGRFTDKDGSQACGIGFVTSQKAHNALRWLIDRQGRQDVDQAIVAWAPSGKAIPRLDHDSSQFLYDDVEAAPQDITGVPATSTHAHVAQAFALRLKKKIGGYQAELGDTADIVVIALDSATPGRMAITFYRELRASEFLQRIEAWHAEAAWHQNYGKTHLFVGAPAPRDIAEVAYGRRLDDKLLAATSRRLLPCIIDAIPIPRDFVESCVRRANNRTGIEPWEWEKALGIACALYRKQTIREKNYLMALEPLRTDRDYLYGRLLAIAEQLESYALYLAGENRATNAARLMQRFADHPCDTWRTLYLALDPYRARLRTRRPGVLHVLETEIDAIVSAFAPADFTSPNKLSGEFLLGYHCQRAALKAKPEAKNTDDQELSANETA